MERNCRSCMYARISAGDEQSENHVSCISIPDGMKDEDTMLDLTGRQYTGETFAHGWTYHQCPPDGETNGIMSSTYIIVETNQKCLAWKPATK